jgi:dihydroflavonol-4-reductase
MTRRAAHKPKKALVTGGAGFIGSNLVPILLENDVAVRVMVMPGDPAHNLKSLRSKIEVVEGDLLDSKSLLKAVDGCDTLFHLAAIYAVWLPQPRLMYDVNVQGSLNMMTAALEAGVKRIVHTSSIAAVGQRPGGKPANEDTEFNAWNDASDYVMSKYISELQVLKMRARGLPVVVVNPAFPFGWGDVGPTPTGAIVREILKGVPFYFEGGFNAVSVKDVAMGHWLAARYGKLGQRYILAGENMSYIEFSRRVARIAGVRAPKVKMPRSLVLGLGRLGDFIADNITHHPPLMAESSMKYAVGRELFFDISRARADLGYKPSPTDEAINSAVDWFRHGRKSVKAG